MKPQDYEFLVDLLKRESGLSLNAEKEYLMTSRLNPVAASLGLTDLEGLIRRLRFQADPDLVRTVTEAMNTHESYFFRDVKPFDTLREDVLPTLMEARRKTSRLRIWCAACSTAQEPYSIAMLIAADFPELKNWRPEILGTDISKKILDRAGAGLYSHLEVQRGLPVTMLVRFFRQCGRDWQIDPKIREMVDFKQVNLLEPYTNLGQFDVIFCRNVLIYFDGTTKTDVLNRMARALAPDGYLFLGGAETVLGLSSEFERNDSRGLYYKKRQTLVPSSGTKQEAAAG